MSQGNLSWEASDINGVWIGESREPGPTVAVIGGVHGSERTGIEIIRNHRDEITVDCGTVVLMLGNLLAIDANTRNSESGVNLNRQFRELATDEVNADPETLAYEVRRAQELLPFLKMPQLEGALDLHDYTKRTGQSFIISERRGWGVARKIGAPVISCGWSITETGGTDGYMESEGKIGIVYEVGQKREVRKNTPKGMAVVERFLGAMGLVETSLEPLHEDPLLIQTDHAVTRESEQYRLAGNFVTFQPLEEGTLIALHGGEPIYASAGDIIIFPERKPEIGTEAFTIGRIVAA
jgi:succinylglutamate desuccinylase